MIKDFISILRCPNTYEKLSLISKTDLYKIYDNAEKLGDQFLINESKSFFYRISEDIPILLPEEGIKISTNFKNNINENSPSSTLSTYLTHKKNLEYLYKKDTQNNKVMGLNYDKLKWKSAAVHKPLSDGLNSGSVLDVGGGLGLFRNAINNRLHLNVDVSEILLKLDPSSYKINGRSERIPVLDESFDNVVSSRSMEHCQDLPKTMSELVRCLKPGGRLVVACWREDWPACQKNSIWVISNLIYFLEKAFAMAKTNPSLLLNRLLFKLRLTKHKNTKRVKNIWGDEGYNQIYSRRFNRDVFQKMLEKTGVQIIKKGYCGKDFPGPIEPPRFIVDKFFDQMKYGVFFFFVCEKSG